MVMLRSVLAAALALSIASPLSAQPTAAVTDLPDGLVGEFYPPPGGGKAPLILVLSGSQGGVPRPMAADLNAEGFGVLALAYFGAPGLPDTAQSIALEYFERATAWLARQPSGSHRRVAVLGGSKGAEAALLAAAGDPRICAVVANVPSSVSWSGIGRPGDQNPGPSWTRGGRPVAYVPFDPGRDAVMADRYSRRLDGALADTFIPVERIRGPVLLISGGQDRMWPSTRMADQIMARLDRTRFPFPHEHLRYDAGGHAVFGKPDRPIPDRVVANGGGTAEGNQAARLDNWPKAVAFLKEAFRSGCR
jgi:uncharacterized protein